MLSLTKDRYASVAQEPMVFSFDDRVQFPISPEVIFGYSEINNGFRTNESVQQGRVDIRIFNFTKFEIVNVTHDGFRVRLNPINVAPYITKERFNLRADVACMVSTFGDNLKDNIVIVQRRQLQATSELELNQQIRAATVNDIVNKQMLDIKKSIKSIAGVNYWVCDVVIIYNLHDTDFGIYNGCLECNSGLFFSKEPYISAQPHPDDRNIKMVNAELYSGDVTKCTVCTIQHVYSQAKPEPLYMNFLGSSVKITQVFSDNLKEGVHITHGYPGEAREQATSYTEFYSVEDLTEENGFYKNELLAIMQLGKKDHDKHFGYFQGMNKGLSDIAKSVDSAFSGPLVKAFAVLGESNIPKQYLMNATITEALKRIDKNTVSLIEASTSFRMAESNKKAAQEAMINEQRAVQEKIRMVPVVLGSFITILSMLSKKK